MLQRHARITSAALLFSLAMPGLVAAADPAAPVQKAAAGAKKADSAKLERGKYLVKIAGCNDYHTPDYMASAGKVDEKPWLTGDALG